MNTQIIGFIAATLTTISFLPQAIKTWRTHSTDDLSPLMFALFCAGVFSWLIYGIVIHDTPIILANFITLILAGSIMYFIIRNREMRRISHIGIHVKDLEKMKSFYTEKFSVRASKRYDNPKKRFSSYFLTFSSGAHLELIHISWSDGEINNKNFGHIAISVGNKHSVDIITNSLLKDGVEIISMPRTTGNGFYESLVSDPEGNQIEITE
jgi:lactoylglutathione lyase